MQSPVGGNLLLATGANVPLMTYKHVCFLYLDCSIAVIALNAAALGALRPALQYILLMNNLLYKIRHSV